MQAIKLELKHKAADLPADRSPAPPSAEAQCAQRAKVCAARFQGWVEHGTGTEFRTYCAAEMQAGCDEMLRAVVEKEGYVLSYEGNEMVIRSE